MTHEHRILWCGVLAFCILVPTNLFAAPEDASPKPEAKPAEAAKPAEVAPPAKPARELSPALAALRDQVRPTLAAQQKQTFNTRDNFATEIVACCLAFGCNTEVSWEGPEGRRVNGITCLCWNYPCGGFELLGMSEGHIAARVGYGYQEQPGEFLAMLAMSRVQGDYPVRVGQTVRNVADIVEGEKLACRSGNDLSLALVGLSYYVEEPEWKNDLGETWSIDRILSEEMAQPVVTAPEGGLNRLLGLSYAVMRRAKRGQPIDGQYERARKYVADFQEFALQLQNTDGSWGPYFLAAKSTSPDIASQLRSSGRILEWLALSLPEQKIEDPRMLKGVEYVTGLLGTQRYQWNTPSLSTREIVSVGHALHALNIYDERVFKPADLPPAAQKPAADKPAPAADNAAGK